MGWRRDAVRAFCLVAALAIGSSADAQMRGAPRLTGDTVEAAPLLTSPPYVNRFASFETAPTAREAARQHRLLAQALQGLAPQRPGQTDVYVMAAGLDSDRVFGNEAREAATILSRRYSAQNRTLLLANGYGAGSDTVPAASPQHFAAAIGAIGALMDPAEDVLVLFVTAHGGENTGVVFKDDRRLASVLSPAALDLLLRDAGITNRVVIVSACFSGAFVPTLGDARTVVVTAAAADRTSFGCAPQNDWTYFGEAFFAKALARGLGLKSAFEAATTTVADWEARDKLPDSRPQLHIGREAEAWLTQIEASPAR